MAIKIIEEPDIQMTQGEYNRLKEEYKSAMAYRAGGIPTFEEWVRSRKLLNEQV